MIERLLNLIADEPAVITAVIVAVIDLVAALGFDVPVEVIGVVTAILAVVQGVATRRQVVPSKSVVLRV